VWGGVKSGIGARGRHNISARIGIEDFHKMTFVQQLRVGSNFSNYPPPMRKEQYRIRCTSQCSSTLIPAIQQGTAFDEEPGVPMAGMSTETDIQA